MLVTLRYKRKDPWAGISKYKNCFDYLPAFRTRSGNFHTGLTPDDERRFEKEFGYAEGTLAPTSQFWETFSIKIGLRDTVLDTSIPRDEFNYLFLKGNKKVANGLNDEKPGTDYVLINQELEAIELNRVNKRRRDAIKEFEKMSLDEMRKCLRILGYKSDSMSGELIESKMFEVVESDPERFFSKWVKNLSRNTEFIVESAISKNIIRRNKNIYYYGSEIIGHSMDDAVSHLDDKKNQDLKMAIMDELGVKK